MMNSFWYAVLFIPFVIYIHKVHKDLFKIIIVVLIIYSISLSIFNLSAIKESDSYNITVVNHIKVDTYTSFLGRIKGQYVKVYFDENLSIKPGDKLTLKGEIEIPLKSTIPNTFDYKNYLKSQNIKYTMFAKEVEYYHASISLFIVPYYIEKYIDNHMPLSGNYIKTFIIADKGDIDTEVKESINKIGISHLFAVSGLHIAMLVLALEYILSKLSIGKTKSQSIIMAILACYLISTSFSPSVSRASLMYILLVINKRYNLEFSTLDILSIIFISLLVIRPYYYYDPGFLLSFLVTFTILLSNVILSYKTKINQLFILSFIAFLVTVPIILNLNYQINILTLIFNIFFLMFVSYIILPLSYLSFFLPFLDKINYIFIIIFESIVNYVSHVNIFILKFYFPNDISIIIYYLLLFTFFMSLETVSRVRIRGSYLILLLLLIYISPNLDPTKSVSFVDIYGDSTFIVDSFNQCNILIDTGEHDDYNSVINYLKGKNIRKLDYLIITHFHSDHYGESSDIINEFKIDNIISKLNAQNFEGNAISCGTISMYIYPFDYNEQNENNNSIILSLFINKKHYFFTGDMESSRELSFIDNYDLNIDYLKVPHHGSITSSTTNFLNSIKPNAAFIIVSRNNLHGHPHSEVIKRYQELSIPVYRTDLSGTIEVYYIFGKEYKRIHSP
jgi:competence protein ComEC